MSRIGHLVIQPIEDHGVVILDESSGEEVQIDAGVLRQVISALGYFAEVIQAPEPPGLRR